MEYELLGCPPDGPTLRLDHERFSYAGKFVMSSTGKAVVREDKELLAAIAFNEDRTDDSILWLRYVTVRADRRGEGLGSLLAAAVRSHALETLSDYERVRIAVNNPFAFEALSRAGFHVTGETTGLAEQILEAPGTRARRRYHDGLSAFLERDDLADEERAFVREKRQSDPPVTIEPPPLVDRSDRHD
jgi:GNAT superfamily N-acetyltransferase